MPWIQIYIGNILFLWNAVKEQRLQRGATHSKNRYAQCVHASTLHYGVLAKRRRISDNIVNRARWFGNSLELQYKSLSMFLFWFMQK